MASYSNPLLNTGYSSWLFQITTYRLYINVQESTSEKRAFSIQLAQGGNQENK